MGLGADFGTIIEGARQADQRCLTELYRDFNPRLLHYLRMKVPGDFEDIASEIWIAVARGIGNFEGDEGGFRRWLYTIARHQVIAHYRKTGRRNTHPVDHDALDAMGSDNDFADFVTDRMAARETFEKLAACLPPDQAEVVLLRVVAGFSMEDIADVIGKKPGNVRVLLHRALKKLADREMGPPQRAATGA